MDQEPGAGELDPQRRSGESDLQGAPAPLLSGEGGFQQGQGFPQTHGAGERAQHQAVAPPPGALRLPEPSASQRHLRPHVKGGPGKRPDGASRRRLLGSVCFLCLL